ncbi:DNA gyrase/topoisomerase IV subunit A [Flavobacteriaceae bacterium]|uniref:DNA gyrase/topoisomerase IV subunit A n=1 Tax=Candidatus Arcticimaribacter forsetii TaxID=2820661 RepID=UPI00207773D5|nr:DNA gyrase/topoisomerase IV subunit A [Candidatus Arcticimaribacter forsetii]MDB2325493.1 DNA gyrase/topoisomerase IV subunit A [Flavobacteriaceae bacterium]MDB2346054.1 DNA gyrase/topoisomerase IV subunit A [Flavobacteriaceae bacterium]
MEEKHFYEENTGAATSDTLIKVTGMYKDWFLDYASYVILERAVPAISDGLKPVQRRILHSMKDLDDGRYNKVANIVGHTMQYHPHGDASIADAMVQIGQKDLMIDMQGNWGNILTGDRAAASRYIEARLSKFALEVVFSPKVTNWQLSYDGRKKEPVYLPVKFPLLLAQGAEGIAVGLSTKILPHNFNELIQASIAYLKGKKFILLPDFQTGGIIDVQNYNDGMRGGKVRVRAKISAQDKSTLVITEIPFSTTTSSLIESILKANEKGKIRIKKIEDNTAANVEILIHLPAGISPDKTIDALYAFTACETSISPLGCVIVDHKPHFIGVSDMLRISTDSTVHTLKKELEVKLNELENQWHFASLERIFIENKVYRLIEDQETWEGVLTAIDEGLKPFVKVLKRPVVEDDLVRLTEIKIKRISKFDIDKAQQRIDALEGEIKEVRNNLDNLIEYAIDYFTHLKKEYGKDKDRLSEIRVFDDVDATKVVVRNLKLYVNKEEGFIGTSLKKDEYVCDCADIDDIIVFTKSGIMQVVKVDSKVFIEKDIIYAAVFKKKDQRTIYNLVYKDGKGGTSYIKRFAVTGVTRDKPYNLTQGKSGSEILYFSANPNGEAETITVLLRNTGTVKKLKWELDFADLQIKGRGVKGNIVSKYNILRVELKEKGVSTLKPRKIWFDPTVQKLNVDERGNLLGAFRGDDKLLLVDEKGVAKTVVPDLSLHFDIIPLIMERWVQERPITAVYFDSEKDRYFIKRFLIENKNKEDNFIGDNAKLIFVSSEWRPVIELVFVKPRGGDPLPNKSINVEDFISIKGFKAIGNQLTTTKIKEVILSDSLPYEEPKEEPLENLDVIDANQINDSDSNDTQTKLEL